MPPDQERALYERVLEEARREQARDVDGLCEMILPKYRENPQKLAASKGEFQKSVMHIESVEVTSFAIGRWWPSVESYGGSPAAQVLTEVRYNGSPELGRYRTVWVRHEGQWYTTRVGMVWLGTSNPGEP